ncbi:MAG: VTT domain-containing protein [Nanoarchaeota archaeon]
MEWGKKDLIKAFFFIIILILAIIFIFNLKNINHLILNLVDYINSLEAISPFIFIIIILGIIIGSWLGLSFIIPIIAASLPINVFYAFLISYSILIVSSSLEFIIVRKIGRKYIEEKFINKVAKVHEYNSLLHENGFPLMLTLRLISLIPFELVNLFGALSKLKFKDYFLGTIIGLIPGLIITLYFLRNITDSSSKEFFISLIIFILFIIIPLLSKRIRRVVLK